MAVPAGVGVSTLAGRGAELGAIGSLLADAAAGSAVTLLVTGDAGVGKTALVKRACDGAPDALVLFGPCLPLASMSVPFLALRSAVRSVRWVADLARIVFSDDEQDASGFPLRVDAWLDELSVERPVVLVIDDLQWADQSTLDVLMYLIAGPEDRRLAIVATIRSGEVADGHPLQRWLANVLRLPRVSRLPLSPLDRIATGVQIAEVFGAEPHQSLVDDTFSHSRGNPYLNRLLVTGLNQQSRHLAPELPPDLDSAVLHSWHRLSPATRDLTRILALGGRPFTAGDLAAVAGGSIDVDISLRDASDAGLLDVASEGTYWFHHPLIAEVLERRETPEDRRHWHGRFASFLEQSIDDTSAAALETVVAIADHHFAADHLPEAYRWALEASDAAGEARGSREMLRLLRRAVEVRPKLDRADESQRDLVQRWRIEAAEAGEYEDELEAVESLLNSTDRIEKPLDVAELLVRRMHLRFSTGQAFISEIDMREAVALANADESSWQFALAVAELSHAELWHQTGEPATHAELAFAVATAAGDPRALAYAVTAKALVAVYGRRGEEGRVLAAAGVAAAVQARDWWAFVHAANWEANAMEIWSSHVYADQLKERREQLAALGAPHAYIAKLSADEASCLLAVGDWRECIARLRVALGSNPGPIADVHARLTAARLATWQGRQSEAEDHLARADELFAESSEFLAFPFDAVRAEVLLGRGKFAEAFDAAMLGARLPGVPPTMCEWLLPIAARALANAVRSARDDSRDTSVLLAKLDRLTAEFPLIIRDFGEPTAFSEHQVVALTLLYAAEVGRALDSADNAVSWAAASDACAASELAWEASYSCMRAAEALLLHGHQRPVAAASALRRGLDLAEELQAEPIRRQLVDLAQRARIPLDRPTLVSHAVLPGLTPREREILEHVVAGRTYGEIARVLVISEKTVSSHISHLLRKTGASNRMDLARLATNSMST